MLFFLSNLTAAAAWQVEDAAGWPEMSPAAPVRPKGKSRWAADGYFMPQA